MFKHLITLLVLLLPMYIFSGELNREYNFSAPVINDGIMFLENCKYLDSDFNPDMVMKTARLLLPSGKTVKSFSVDYGNPVMLQGSFSIRPYIPCGRISVEPPDGYRSIRGDAYAKDEFFPAHNTRADSRFKVMYKNGHAIFLAMITPVQHNPVTGQIQYYPKVSLKVNFTTDVNAPVYKCNSFIRSQLKELVDNPEVIDNLPDSPRGPDDYEYLIITSSGLKDKWGALTDFNKKRCMRSKVVAVSDITRIPGIRGRDDQETIRNYIKTEYETNNIVFVNLGGDVELVPCRGMHTSFFDYGVVPYEDYNIPADLYFSCLDGTWQKAGSQYYGEYGCDEDIGWDVYASRYAIDSETELNNMINKTIKYTESPVMGTVKNIMLGGEKAWDAWAWDPNQNKYVKTGETCWGDDEMKELVGQCTNNGYTTEGWQSNVNIKTLYEGEGTWSGDMAGQLISAFQTHKPTFMDHVGHSNTNYILKLSTSQVSTSNFPNNGTNANFFIVNTSGCYPGAFDNATPNGSQIPDCIAEKFTTISTAAVAFMSCTRYGLGADGREGSTGNSPLTDGSSHRFLRYFHDGLYKNISYIEMANGYSKEQNKDWVLNSDPHGKPYHGQMKYICYEMNVLGDPALSVWTAEPQTLTANYPTPLNKPSFTWDSKLPYAWVALVDDGEIVSTQLTGSDGNVKIDDQGLVDYLTQNPGKDLKVRVKAHNYLLFEGDLVVDLTAIHNKNKAAIINGITFFGKTAQVNYTLQTHGNVTVGLYNARGSLLKTVVNAQQAAGNYSVSFNRNILSNGVYYCRVAVDNSLQTKKFIVTK